MEPVNEEMLVEQKQTDEKEEKPVKRQPRKKDTSADQYLAATVIACDWINQSYKDFAVKYKAMPRVFREIYMCACDGVPLELMEIAVKKEASEEMLRLCRRRHIEAQMQRLYASELEEIKYISAEIKQEIKGMADVVNTMAEYIPFFDEMFPKTLPREPTAQGIPIEKIWKVHEKKENVPESGTLDGIKQNVLESGTKKKNLFLDNVKRRLEHKDNPTKFLERLYREDYQSEQLEFILDCIEEGMSEKQVKNIISPKFSVEFMERLKKLELTKKEDRNGKR